MDEQAQICALSQGTPCCSHMTGARGSKDYGYKSHKHKLCQSVWLSLMVQKHQRAHSEEKHHEYKQYWKAFRGCSYVQIHRRTHSGKNSVDESNVWKSSILWAAFKDIKKLTGERNTMYLSNGGKPAVFSVHPEGIKDVQCTEVYICL